MTRGNRRTPCPASPHVLPLSEREPVNPYDGREWSLEFPDLERIEREIARVPALRGRERERRFLLGWIDLQAGAYLRRVTMRDDLGWGRLDDLINFEIAKQPRGVVSAEVAEYQEAQCNRSRGRSRTLRERIFLVQAIAGGFRMVGVPVRKSAKSVFVRAVEIVLFASHDEPPKDALEVVKAAMARPLGQSEPMKPMVIEHILPAKKLGEK